MGGVLSGCKSETAMWRCLVVLKRDMVKYLRGPCERPFPDDAAFPSFKPGGVDFT